MKNFIITLSLLTVSFISFAQVDFQFSANDMPEDAPANSIGMASLFHVSHTEKYSDFRYLQYLISVNTTQLEQFANICKKHSKTQGDAYRKLGSFECDEIRSPSNTWDKIKDEYYDVATFDGSIEVWSNGNGLYLLFPNIKTTILEAKEHKISITNASYKDLLLALKQN